MTEDLSQPISESYFHLSQESESDITTTTFDMSPRANHTFHDTSILLKLAQVIDKENKDTIPKSTTKEKNKANLAKSYKRSYDPLTSPLQSKSNGQPGSQHTEPAENGKRNAANMSSLFSSHSTPLLPKQGTNPKWRKFSHENILPDIDESKNDDETINELVHSLRRVNLDDANQEKYTLDDLYSGVVKLLDSNFGDQIKTSLKELIEQKEQSKQTEKSIPAKQTFQTPYRREIKPINNDSSDEEDNLSLNAPLDVGRERKGRIDHNGSFSKGITEIDHAMERHTSIDQDTPRTTPPHSQEEVDSKLQSTVIEPEPHVQKITTDAKSNTDNERLVGLEKEMNTLRHESQIIKDENDALKSRLRELEMLISKENNREGDKEEDKDHNLNLIDITLESVDFSEMKLNDKQENEQLLNSQNQDLKARNMILSKELDKLKENFAELVNEFKWEKAKNDKRQSSDEFKVPKNKVQEDIQTVADDELSKPTDGLTKQLEAQKIEISKLKDEIKSINEQIGDKSKLLTGVNVDSRFSEYYNKLGLEKVDSMTKVEMSNLIKNLMLSLLISDFSNLAANATKYGKFLKLALRFMDHLHEIVYLQQCAEVKPSYYIKTRGDNANLSNLQECLNGMIENIKLLRMSNVKTI
ncbi:uncharacterized protein RJT20DRAFT_45323 [Scheffersomyces xylosifermentans]|uniref:uncharacterized protein n=1 Tax=Scheffersomyces xylosifermentans TaxID=1304137 RepID=UPI00315C930A